MKIFVKGEESRWLELKTALPQGHEVTYAAYDEDFSKHQLENYDVIMDLNADDDCENLNYYASLKDKIVILSAVKNSLTMMAVWSIEPVKCKLAGMNFLPGMITRNVKEVSALNEADKNATQKIFDILDWQTQWVDDRAGMITPRIVCMIINEAYYTLMEGTAGKEDINTGMKLGTNYPHGPFEWCDILGIKNVYEILKNLYEDTGEERYKICPLLKKEYLHFTMNKERLKASF